MHTTRKSLTALQDLVADRRGGADRAAGHDLRGPVRTVADGWRRGGRLAVDGREGAAELLLRPRRRLNHLVHEHIARTVCVCVCFRFVWMRV